MINFFSYIVVIYFYQDAAKVFTFKLIKKTNLFQYNDTGMVPNHSHPSMDDLQSPSTDCLETGLFTITKRTNGYGKKGK